MLADPQELGADSAGPLPQSQVWPVAFARRGLRAERGHVAPPNLDDLEFRNEDPAKSPGGHDLRRRHPVSMKPFPNSTTIY